MIEAVSQVGDQTVVLGAVFSDQQEPGSGPRIPDQNAFPEKALWGFEGIQ
jgi:hypothetical protein